MESETENVGGTLPAFFHSRVASRLISAMVMSGLTATISTRSEYISGVISGLRLLALDLGATVWSALYCWTHRATLLFDTWSRSAISR